MIKSVNKSLIMICKVRDFRKTHIKIINRANVKGFIAFFPLHPISTPLMVTSNYAQQKMYCGFALELIYFDINYTLFDFINVWTVLIFNNIFTSNIFFTFASIKKKHIYSHGQKYCTLGKYDQRRLWKCICIVNPFDLLFIFLSQKI